MLSLLFLLALVVSGCGGGQASGQPEPREGRAGLQFTGTVDGRQVGVRDGAPELVVGDCDPIPGPDEDVCAISQTINSETFVLVFENPSVLVSDTELEVADSPCDGAACDQVRDHAVVDVQIGEERVRARGGELRLEVVEPFLHYRGELRLEFADGSLSGLFDVVPRDR